MVAAPIYTWENFILENRTRNPKLRRIARRLIANEPELADIAASGVRIAFLTSDAERKDSGKLVYGLCERVPDKYKWCVPYDFTITVFEPNVERFNKKQLEILLLHELMHIGVEQDGFEEKYSIIPHDVEDFRAIIDRYGLDWSEDDTT